MEIRQQRVFHILLILVVAIIAYSNTFTGVFQFDDIPNIVRNPDIKDLRNFVDPIQNKGSYLRTRYVAYLTFAINYKLHGLNVIGYHIFNFLVHVINGVLVYFLVVLVFRTPSIRQTRHEDARLSRLIALFSSLIFVCHPIQTQAVTYIVQRLASLTTMFYLLSVVMYIRSRLDSTLTSALTVPFYLLSLFSAVLAMRTKEIAFTLPIVIAMVEYSFLSGPLRKRLMILMPYVIMMSIIPLSLIGFEKPVGDLIGDVSSLSKVQTDVSRSEYLYTQFTVVTKYIGLLLFPINQNLDHDHPIYGNFVEWPVVVSFLFLAVLFGSSIVLLYRSRNRDPGSGISDKRLLLVSFGMLWFFITLSVESTIIPIVDVIFEHRVYLPSVGFISAITSFLFIVFDKLTVRNRGPDRISTVIFSIIVIALTMTTYTRNAIWNDEIPLWEDVVRKSPNKVRGYNNLCSFYSQRRMYDKALINCNKAIAVKPDHTDAYINRGAIFRATDQPDAAIEDYRIAAGLAPGNPRIYNNLGNVYGQTGQVDKAIESYTVAIRLNGKYEKAYMNRGTLYDYDDQYDMALKDFTQVIEIDPYHSEAFVKRGLVYSKKGNIEKALNDLMKACELGNKRGCNLLKAIKRGTD